MNKDPSFKIIRDIREWADEHDWLFYGHGRYSVTCARISKRVPEGAPDFPVVEGMDNKVELLKWANAYLSDV